MPDRPIETIPIELIRLDFQPVRCLDAETVELYADVLRRGEDLPPVTVRFDGETYWLQDGFHRVSAARIVGLRHVTAEVIPGTYADMNAEWQDYLRALRANLQGDTPGA